MPNLCSVPGHFISCYSFVWPVRQFHPRIWCMASHFILIADILTQPSNDVGEFSVKSLLLSSHDSSSSTAATVTLSWSEHSNVTSYKNKGQLMTTCSTWSLHPLIFCTMRERSAVRARRKTSQWGASKGSTSHSLFYNPIFRMYFASWRSLLWGFSPRDAQSDIIHMGEGLSPISQCYLIHLRLILFCFLPALKGPIWLDFGTKTFWFMVWVRNNHS